MPIPGWGTSALGGTMSERGEIEREAVETIERASEGAGVQLDVKLGRGRAQLLQVSAAEKHTPWYREARGIVSALALFVSATSLAYTWRSDRAAELRQKRQELRQIVQELTEMRLRYVADLARMSDPQQQRDIGNILQAKQSILLEAAEVLADDIPREVTSSAYRTLAWENVYDARLAQAERLFRGALEASRTPTARALAYRDLGSFYAADLAQVEKARGTPLRSSRSRTPTGRGARWRPTGVTRRRGAISCRSPTPITRGRTRPVRAAASQRRWRARRRTRRRPTCSAPRSFARLHAGAKVRQRTVNSPRAELLAGTGWPLPLDRRSAHPGRDRSQVVRDRGPVDRSQHPSLTPVPAARHPEAMFETCDARFTSRTPRAPAAEPPLPLVVDPLPGAEAGFRYHRVMDAERPHPPLAVRGIEAAIHRHESGRPPKDATVPFDRRHQQRRVVLPVDHGDLRHDAALGLLDLHQGAELRRAMELPAPENLRGRLKEAHQLVGAGGHSVHDAAAGLAHDLLHPREHRRESGQGAARLPLRRGR